MSIGDMHGFYDGIWRKNGILPGGSKQLSVELDTTGTTNGTNTINAFTVPAKEVWFINSIAIFTGSATCTVYAINFVVGGSVINFARIPNPTANLSYHFNLFGMFSESDIIQTFLTGMTAGDRVVLSLFGYILELSE